MGRVSLHQADKLRPGNSFHPYRVPISKFFDGKSKDKFQVQADEAILFVDAGEGEYETDVFFLAKGGYKHEPVDY